MLRLAVTYAILDLSHKIEPAHIRAAEACWRYNVATVKYVFGSLRGDTEQDKLLAELRAVYPGGLTGAQQADLFARNLKAGALATARAALEHDGFVRTELLPAGEKGGRREIISYAIPQTSNELNESTGANGVAHGLDGADSFNSLLRREKDGDAGSDDDDEPKGTNQHELTHPENTQRDHASGEAEPNADDAGMDI